ncbi:hypothetical protein ACGF3K_04625 [Streptomyces sp. NPDC047980]|uniref:hypothetical protein n=1 Tax=Streptomyces sp. NPDC047980 TaxID=3365494 RepID=UPI003719D1C2
MLVVAVEPARSGVVSGGAAGPHGIPGIGAGCVSEITDLPLVDEIVAVTDEDSAATARESAATTGVVTVFPDSGERCLPKAAHRPED